MSACTWRRPGTCQSVGTALYCRGLEDGHAGPHQEEVLSPSNVHADVLRAFVENQAKYAHVQYCACGPCACRDALDDAEDAAQDVREGRY